MAWSYLLRKSLPIREKEQPRAKRLAMRENRRLSLIWGLRGRALRPGPDERKGLN